MLGLHLTLCGLSGRSATNTCSYLCIQCVILSVVDISKDNETEEVLVDIVEPTTDHNFVMTLACRLKGSFHTKLAVDLRCACGIASWAQCPVHTGFVSCGISGIARRQGWLGPVANWGGTSPPLVGL